MSIRKAGRRSVLEILFRRRTVSCQSQQHPIVSERLGRLIACDLIGTGGSDKLPDLRPERYSYHDRGTIVRRVP